MTKEELKQIQEAELRFICENAEPKPPAAQVRQKFLDEINQQGEVVSQDEFVQETTEQLKLAR